LLDPAALVRAAAGPRLPPDAAVTDGGCRLQGRAREAGDARRHQRLRRRKTSFQLTCRVRSPCSPSPAGPPPVTTCVTRLSVALTAVERRLSSLRSLTEPSARDRGGKSLVGNACGRQRFHGANPSPESCVRPMTPGWLRAKWTVAPKLGEPSVHSSIACWPQVVIVVEPPPVASTARPSAPARVAGGPGAVLTVAVMRCGLGSTKCWLRVLAVVTEHDSL